jgi:hypothetical protein
MFAVLAGFVWCALRASTAPQRSGAVVPAEAPAVGAPSRSDAPPADDHAEVRPPLLPEAGSDAEAPQAFASIDLDAVRKAIPDNAYWDNLAPTQDPRLLGDRERAAQRRNELYGKILSGTGTDDEIRQYFDERTHLSSDYVRFVDWVIEHQSGDLSEQDLELLHVAKRLHLARLEEIPRRMQEAFDRRAKQDAARAAWQAEQRDFESDDGSPAPGKGDSTVESNPDGTH